MNSSFVTRIALIAVAASAMVATTGHAQTVPSLGSTTGEIGFGSGLPAGWSDEGSNAANGYNFIYSSITSATGTGAADNSGIAGDHVVLQGVQTLPAAGSFLALDGDYNIAQSTNHTGGVAVGAEISGLVANTSYTLSYWAADDQQTGFTGDTTDTITACVGATSANPESGTCGTTPTVDDPNSAGAHDTGFVEYFVNFSTGSTVVGGQELLTFFDAGTPSYPNQEPSFALIDDINVVSNPNPTPEPSSLMLLGTGLAGLSGLVRSRFKKAAKV
jgi:hypothetical protein